MDETEAKGNFFNAINIIFWYSIIQCYKLYLWVFEAICNIFSNLWDFVLYSFEGAFNMRKQYNFQIKYYRF